MDCQPETYFTCAKPFAGILSAIALMDDDASSLLTAYRPMTAFGPASNGNNLDQSLCSSNLQFARA